MCCFVSCNPILPAECRGKAEFLSTDIDIDIFVNVRYNFVVGGINICDVHNRIRFIKLIYMKILHSLLKTRREEGQKDFTTKTFNFIFYFFLSDGTNK